MNYLKEHRIHKLNQYLSSRNLDTIGFDPGFIEIKDAINCLKLYKIKNNEHDHYRNDHIFYGTAVNKIHIQHGLDKNFIRFCDELKDIIRKYTEDSNSLMFAMMKNISITHQMVYPDREITYEFGFIDDGIYDTYTFKEITKKEAQAMKNTYTTSNR